MLCTTIHLDDLARCIAHSFIYFVWLPGGAIAFAIGAWRQHMSVGRHHCIAVCLRDASSDLLPLLAVPMTAHIDLEEVVTRWHHSGAVVLRDLGLDDRGVCRLAHRLI